MAAKAEILKAIVERAKAGEGLAMDYISRMARAKEQGFDVDRPVYHGASDDIEAFRETKNGKAGAGGVYFTNDPERASKYASMSAKFGGASGRGDAANVTQANLRMKNPYISETGMPYNEDVNSLANAGYDGIILKGEMPGGGDEIIVFDPANIRSTNAAFDPAKAKSSDLLASAAPVAVGAAALAGSDESSASPLGRVAKELAERAKGGDALAMDYTSRMERAAAQGFEGETYYKGMYPYDWSKEKGSYPGPEIEAIDRQTEFPSFSDDPGIDIAGFITKDIDVANRFSGLGSGGAVYPLKYKKGRELVIDAKGEKAGDVQFKEGGQFFRDAARSGDYDTISIVNTADEGDITVALTPSNIRSINATFDPAKSKLSDMLASMGALGVGVGAMGASEESEAGALSTVADILKPLGQSKMIGNEKLILDSPDLKIYEADPEWQPKGTGKSYRYVKYEEGQPVGAIQFATKGPRSNKAVIQNLHTEKANRRQGVAAGLLDRARQDFDVKHSKDLTDAGRAFSKAVPGVAGVGMLGAIPDSQAALLPAVNMPDDRIEAPESGVMQGLSGFLRGVKDPLGNTYESTANVLDRWSHGESADKMDLLLAPMEFMDPTNLPALIGHGAQKVRR